MAPIGAGTPTKNLVLPRRLHRALDHDIEARQTKACGNHVDEGGDPAYRTRLIEHIDIDDEGRGDAEIDDVCQTIHLFAEFGCRLHHPGDAPVDAVEEGGKEHHAHGQLEPTFNGEAHAAQARADGQNGDEVGYHEAKGNFPQARPTAAVVAALMFSVLLRLRDRRFHGACPSCFRQPRRLRTGPLAEPNSARTVSPAIAVWPTETRG